MLPLRNYARVEEFNDPDAPILPVSKEYLPVRKRKAWKKEPTAKVARTDLFMVSVRSFTDEFVELNCANESDIKKDTAVACRITMKTTVLLLLTLLNMKKLTYS